MTPEKKVKARAVKVLKRLGCWYFFPFSGGYGRAGVPDIICCFRGRLIAIECKAGSKGPTKLQKLEMETIERAGGVSILFNEDVSPDQLERQIKAVQ
tara:strand:+ start:356 stop:646 length:291 start_codon:yes stop_codon:yes gene_type:complete